MASLLCPSVPYYRNDTFRPGLAALVAFLMERDYSSHSIGRIFDFVACNGTLEGSLVELEDMAETERTFVDALPAIDFDNPCWGGPDSEDIDDVDAILSLPAIAGGAPEDLEPAFDPSQSDWEDYSQWAADLDARRATDDYLTRFNEERQGWTEVPA
jgi:hypothetical protein